MTKLKLLAGVLTLSLASTAFAYAGETSTGRMQKLMQQMAERSPNSATAQRRLHNLVAAMQRSTNSDERGSSDLNDDVIEQIVTAKQCRYGTALNRDRLEPALLSCGTVRLVRVTRTKDGRTVRETVTRNGTNTVYRRQIGRGHSLAVKQRGAHNTVAVLQTD